jgi:hypothetical protein
MTSYKEYKEEDYARRIGKQEKCLHVEKIIDYTMCSVCGKHKQTILIGEDTHKALVPSELLCSDSCLEVL